jgi:hypothetical protein
VPCATHSSPLKIRNIIQLCSKMPSTYSNQGRCNHTTNDHTDGSSSCKCAKVAWGPNLARIDIVRNPEKRLHLAEGCLCVNFGWIAYIEWSQSVSLSAEDVLTKVQRVLPQKAPFNGVGIFGPRGGSVYAVTCLGGNADTLEEMEVVQKLEGFGGKPEYVRRLCVSDVSVFAELQDTLSRPEIMDEWLVPFGEIFRLTPNGSQKSTP